MEPEYRADIGPVRPCRLPFEILVFEVREDGLLGPHRSIASAKAQPTGDATVTTAALFR
jgi:hypothetical protein